MQDTAVIEDVIARLEDGGLNYMLTGSVAVSYYALPRMTRDVDIVVELVESDVQRIVELFGDAYYLDELAAREAIARRGSFNLIHYTALVKVDLIVRKDTEYRMTEFGRRRRVMLGNISAWLVAPEDLVLSKLDWARQSRSEQQLRDVRNILSSDEPLDRGYLDQWAPHLGLDALLGELSP